MLFFRAHGLLFSLRFPERLPAERDLCPSVSDSALSASAAFASDSVLAASAASISGSVLAASAGFDLRFFLGFLRRDLRDHRLHLIRNVFLSFFYHFSV